MMTRAEQSRKWRAANPMKAAYIILKANAKRRGIPFEISFEYFERFAIETKLLTNRGRKGSSYTVDRIINDIGYVEGNLQMLLLSDNGFKGYLEKSYYFEEAGSTGCLKIKTHRPSEIQAPF